MKKLMALLLAIMMLATLCACGAATPETPETPEIPEVTEGEQDEITEATEEEAPIEEVTEEVTETIPVAVGNADMALAESCIDKTVDELFALIGEPINADYAPSCLNPGVGEDGNLEYDGFIVYTYREGDTETVQYVEEAE